MLRRPTRNVRQSPSGFKLQGRVVIALQKLNKARYDTSIDHLLDRRILLNTQQTTKLRRALRLHGWVHAHHTLNHSRQLLKLGRMQGASNVGRGPAHIAHIVLIKHA
jgi:hypothetical protein